MRLEMTPPRDRFSLSTPKNKALTLSPAHSQEQFLRQLKDVVKQLEQAHPDTVAELKFDLSAPKTAKFGDYLTRLEHYHGDDEFKMSYKTQKGWLRNRYYIKMDGPARKMTPVLKIMIQDLEAYHS